MRAGQRPAEPLCAWAASHQTCGADSLLPLFLVEHGWSESTSRKPDACRGFWKTLQGRVAVSAPCLDGRAAQEVSGLTRRGTWTNLGETPAPALPCKPQPAASWAQTAQGCPPHHQELGSRAADCCLLWCRQAPHLPCGTAVALVRILKADRIGGLPAPSPTGVGAEIPLRPASTVSACSPQTTSHKLSGQTGFSGALSLSLPFHKTWAGTPPSRVWECRVNPSAPATSARSLGVEPGLCRGL